MVVSPNLMYLSSWLALAAYASTLRAAVTLIAAGSYLSTTIHLLPAVRVTSFHLASSILEQMASHSESAAEIFIVISTIGTGKVVFIKVVKGIIQ